MALSALSSAQSRLQSGQELSITSRAPLGRTTVSPEISLASSAAEASGAKTGQMKCGDGVRSRLDSLANHTSGRLDIFTHNDVWVRPSAIRNVIGPKHAQQRLPPSEEHAGSIENSAGMDLGHAILAFDFIDRINDEMLHHYVPLIDDTTGKRLGLQHDTSRLATPDPVEHKSHCTSASSHCESDMCRSAASSDQYKDVNVTSGCVRTTKDAGDGFSPDVTLSALDFGTGGATPSQEIHAFGSSTVAPSSVLMMHGWVGDMTAERTPTPAFLPDYQEQCESDQSTTSSPDDAAAPTSGLVETPSLSGFACFPPAQMNSLSGNRDIPSTPALWTASMIEPEAAVQENTLSMSKDAGLGTDLVQSSIRTTSGLGSITSAALQVWPHASGMVPPSASAFRSSKLRSVDSIPDHSASQSMESTIRPQDLEHRSFLHSSLFQASCVTSELLHLLGLPSSNRPYGIQGPRSLTCATDPTSAGAPASVLYSNGAAKVRCSKKSVGCNQSRSCAGTSRGSCARIAKRRESRKSNSRHLTCVSADPGVAQLVRKSTGECLEATNTIPPPSSAPGRLRRCTDDSTSTGIVNGETSNNAATSTAEQTVTSSAPLHNSARLGKVGSGISCVGPRYNHAFRTGVSHSTSGSLSASANLSGGANTLLASSRDDELMSLPVRKPSPSPADQFDAIICDAGSSRDGRAVVKKNSRSSNETCPFSHDPVESSCTIDLRCGHRFALTQLQAARHAAQLCCSAGLAKPDALICPLCGNQDSTSKPGAANKLTTYSSNAEAYLGALQKDWQMPLELPMQTMEANSGTTHDVDINLNSGRHRSTGPEDCIPPLALPRFRSNVAGRGADPLRGLHMEVSTPRVLRSVGGRCLHTCR